MAPAGAALNEDFVTGFDEPARRVGRQCDAALARDDLSGNRKLHLPTSPVFQINIKLPPLKMHARAPSIAPLLIARLLLTGMQLGR